MTVLNNLTNTGPRFSRLPNGHGFVENLKVFKAGTFKDSLGKKRTWDASHLQAMVENFNKLRREGVFPNVPVRVDHSISAEKVGGYFESLTTDGQFLYANLLLTDPVVADKYDHGTFRSRSLEVGAYETNEEAVYWPAVMGVAFVDIPAVEGLHSQHKSSNEVLASYSQTLQDEPKGSDNMTPEEIAAQAAADKAAADKAAADKAAADAVAAKAAEDARLAAEKAAADQIAAANAAAEKAAADAAAAQEAALAAHRVNGGGAFTFRVNGGDTTDFAAVQTHINALENFVSETRTANRTEFVKSLATKNQILASKLDDMTAHALSLTDEQYAMFTKAYEGAGSAQLFTKHGTDASGGNGEPSAADQAADDLNETVKMFKRSGMPQDKIEKTEAFQKLQKLNTGSAV